MRHRFQVSGFGCQEMEFSELIDFIGLMELIELIENDRHS
ncbi:hypothetical protein D1AOALGA4SA_246 [Olavius algarvensis Delta 1 endosymbiont]|nr:hypothetical protein D1AOALGA4SA_246 [Olavius algarvensis Delta 1 endosymbiont]